VKSGIKLGEFMRDIEFVMCCFLWNIILLS